MIVDLHGAPGSQNGYDNSGQRTGNAVWAINSTNVERTLDYMRFLATNVGDMLDVIELLNEPAGFMGDDWASVLRQYWQDGYNVVRDIAGNSLQVMIGDGFLGVDVSPGRCSSCRTNEYCTLVLDQFSDRPSINGGYNGFS